jgi:hypothetical protein
MALQAIAGSPAAMAMSRMRPVEPPHTWTQVGADALRRDDGTPVSIVQRPASGAADAPPVRAAELAPGARATFVVHVDQPGEYVLLGARMRDAAPDQGTSLAFSLDGRLVASLPARAGSGGAHVALDRTDGTPIRLEAGTHRFEVASSGQDAAVPALVSSIVLHPAIARSRLAGPDGAVDVSWAVDEGRLRIEPVGAS